MKIAPVILPLLISFAGFAQAIDTINRKAEPKGGMAAVAIVYYKIDFTPDEIKYLRVNPPELIFFVDEDGKARLEKVNGIEMKSIVDAMMVQDENLPEFEPEIVDGKRQSAVYFLKISWPQNQLVSPYGYEHSPNEMFINRKLDQFEYVRYANYFGSRTDISIGAVGNMLAGDLSRYNKGGGGMRWDLMYYGNKGWGGGILMSVHGNIQRQEYPINTALPQNRSRTIMFFGIAISKLLKETPRGQFNIQFEPCYASQTIAKDSQLKTKPVVISGFSPGLSIGYLLGLGPGKLSHYYFATSARRSYLHFHVAARPMLLDFPQASGFLIEGGVSYRLSGRRVVDFKSKDK